MNKEDWKNEVTLTGYLVHDPVLTVSKNGVSICKATIRNSKGVKDGEGRYINNFFRLVAFREEADALAECYDKDIITVSGKLIQDTWEKAGEKRSAVSVIVNEHFVNSFADKKEEEEIDPFAEGEEVPEEEGINVTRQDAIADQIINHLRSKGVDYERMENRKGLIEITYKSAVISVTGTGHVQITGQHKASFTKQLAGIIPAVP